jgi:hypothetical protein
MILFSSKKFIEQFAVFKFYKEYFCPQKAISCSERFCLFKFVKWLKLGFEGC